MCGCVRACTSNAIRYTYVPPKRTLALEALELKLEGKS